MSKRNRTPEQQAILDELAAAALALAEVERANREAARRDFAAPRFTRKEVAAVLQTKEETFQNWHARGQIELDADNARGGTKWRLYSVRDVLRLGFIIQLSQIGFPAKNFRKVLEQVEHLFSIPGPHLSSNRITYVLVFEDGTASAARGSEIDLTAIAAGKFIVVRLDLLVQTALEPLGYSITYGTADEMRRTIKRLEGEK